MRKIQKVIDSCYDCEFRHVFNGMKGGTTKAHLCVYGKDDEAKENDSKPFLLDLCSNGSNELPIPDKCPLEDYKETETPKT